MVARPAILYIQDIPVMWFPFIFQDSRSGRHSGILTPQFGLTELLRNSPDYRRTVYNAGYYFALSDYYDAQVSMDWRSAAKATDVDPGLGLVPRHHPLPAARPLPLGDDLGVRAGPEHRIVELHAVVAARAELLARVAADA